MTDQRDAGGEDPHYAHKPSLMGAAWEFCLRPDALEWRTGGRQGRIPYGRITRVRLSFRPLTMQSRRFITEIWSGGAPRLAIVSTSWRSLVENAAQDEAYGAFVRELHRRIAAADHQDPFAQRSPAQHLPAQHLPAQVSFEAGVPPMLYWPGLVVFAIVGLGLAALTVRALQVAQFAGAAVVGGFFGLFLWQSGGYFRRNRPGRYRPDALPKELVPGG
jgi:hypothetical protein